MAVTNDFSWSKSRDEIFRDCLRRYFFHYYGAWGGWDPFAPERTRQLYILKNLQTRAMWIGTKVHSVVQALLASLRSGGEEPTADAAVAQLLADMRRDFRDSLARRYRQSPRKACGLFEHEYELEISDAQWKETADHAGQCLRAFLCSEIFTSLRQLPADAWLEVEELASFTLDGIKVFVQLDCAHHTAEGVRIYDWKTGRAENRSAELQLACYALYAAEKWQLPSERVQTVEFNLTSGQATPRVFTAEALEETKDYIRDSADEMSFLLEDPARNKPQPEENFDFAEQQSACHHCNFLKRCPRWV
jgi:CRISPR/Cas system-associated exonuclease Cas4 (RecB family)